MTTIFERADCTLTLRIGDRIEYTVDGGGRQIVIGTPLEGLATLTASLGQSATLTEASRAAAVRDGFDQYNPGSIASEVRRWCHQAGLSSTWQVDGRRTHREHILAAIPQPGTDRRVTLSVAFWTAGDGDEFSFTEQYRRPTEILGYSFGIGLRYDLLPRLTSYLEGDRGTTGDPEERLVAVLGELVAQGTINPLAGQGKLRELFESWCHEAGIDTRHRHRGTDRRETLVTVGTRPDQIATVSFSISSSSREAGIQEAYGTADESWRDALYQLRFGPDELPKLHAWLTNRVGPMDERLGPDDAVVAALRVLAERGELTPRRPMEVRDRVAGWLTEAGMAFRSYGSAWRETLLRVHRQPNDCIFTLSLTIDPADRDKGITFTEFYDYGPSGDDPGREYGYSVHAPYDALDTLANAYAPGTQGPAQDRLVNAFKDLVATGELGDQRVLKANQETVLRGFEAAGVTATPDVWVWLNSD
ncbi:hypothetical protein [Kribbella sp. NPDC004875]|uniref:hypothetical protein n=1 Tax=Kribbella sp. NPDC004875 TaxID=3364107 RepID=UPI0036C58E6B